jgi:hypothetical protein
MRRGDRRLAPIGGELVLHDLPKLRIEDGLVLAGVGFALVNNVAPIEPVLQHQIECPAGEMLAAGQPSAGSFTALVGRTRRISAQPRSKRQLGRMVLMIIISARFWRVSRPMRTPSGSVTARAVACGP